MIFQWYTNLHSYKGGAPPVISWFINHRNSIDISTILNHSSWSYEGTNLVVSQLTGAPPCTCHKPVNCFALLRQFATTPSWPVRRPSENWASPGLNHRRQKWTELGGICGDLLGDQPENHHVPWDFVGIGSKCLFHQQKMVIVHHLTTKN